MTPDDHGTDDMPAADAALTARDDEHARRHFLAVLAAEPSSAGTHVAFGHWLRGRGELTEATSHYAIAAAWSGSAEDYRQLALALRETDREEAARRAFERALAIDPVSVTVLDNLAQLHFENEAFESARTYWQQALAIDPEHALARYNLAFLELACGDLVSGWSLYEARHAVYGIDYENLGMQRWDGKPLDAGALLVLAEQGVGDELLFASCLPDVLERTDRVTLFCEPRLASLFQRSFPAVSVVPVQRGGGIRREIERPDCTHYIEAGSLPGLLRRSVGDFPDTPAYLLSDPARRAYWRKWLAGLGREPRIGLCWRSGLRNGVRARHYASLADFAPLFALPGIRWVSVQYDDCAEELAAVRQRFSVEISEPPFDQRTELDEAAALLAGLDLVITAATAVGELAGALGVPVWRFQIGCGWTALGTGSLPWHPAARLWERRPDERGWQRVFDNMAAELPVWLRNCRPSAKDSAAVGGHGLGEALKDWHRGNLQRAGQRAAAVLALEPGQVDAWHLAALVAREQGDDRSAHAAFLRALVLAPQDASLCFNAAALHERAERFDIAIGLYRRALRLKPDWSDARMALAETLNRRGARALDGNRSIEAMADLGPALELAPDSPDVWNNAALALLGLGRLDEACSAHDEAQRLAPDDARYHWNAAYTRLAAGQITAGWEDYRWRWRGIQTPNDYPYPELVTGASLSGLHVFVYAEQGLGDEILFASCLPDLVAEARAVTLECDPRLLSLYERSFPGVRIYGSYRENFDPARVAADIDVKLPLGELACRYRSSLQAFPADAFTLVPDAARQAAWRESLTADAGGRVLVGLVWRSSLRTHGRTGLYPPLAALAARLARPNLRVIVLQHDADPEEFAVLDQAGVDWRLPAGIDLRNDLDGLASLLSALDLCIGAATATVELAGAIGMPAWRLYPCRSWVMLGAPSCPWHPQLVDFCKTDLTADWDAVLDSIGTALDSILPPPLPALAELLDRLLAPGQLVVLDGPYSTEWDSTCVRGRLGADGLLLRFGSPAGDWPARLAASETPPESGEPSAAGWWAAFRQSGVTLDHCGLPRCDWLVLAAGSAMALAGASATIMSSRPFLLLADAGTVPADYGVIHCADAAGRVWQLAYPLPQAGSGSSI